MREHRDAWRTGPDGTVATEVCGYRLVVRLSERAGRCAFLVLRREGDDGPHALIGSGTEPDVRAAMTKAARMADRLVEPSGGMRRAS